jgi:uncharacterized protein (DUF697 family)
MTTSKNEAMQWVHRYAIGGAVFAALPLPFTTSGLTALEAHMLSTIGDVYRERLGAIPGTAVKAALALAGRGLKAGAERASEPLPKLVRPLVRAAIAGATIEAIGLALVLYYESRAA